MALQVLDLRKPVLWNRHWNSVNFIFVHLCFNAFICWIFCTDEPPVHTVCPVSPSMNVHNKKKQSKMLWNLILLKKNKKQTNKKKTEMRNGDLNYVCTLLWRATVACTCFRWTTQSIPALKPFLHKTASGEITRGCCFLSVWMRFVQTKRCSCHGLEADIAIIIAKRDKMTIH